MLILFKNCVLFLFYTVVCILMLTDGMSYKKGLYYSFFPVMMIYYLVMLFPSVHRYYIFQVMERGFIRWKIIWQTMFHGALLGKIPHVILFMFLLKELKFIIEYAETRLSKIDESLFEKCPGYRIAHLYLNLFKDDIDNRFHSNCYHTNRLYILESTTVSRETQLGISNYREIRRKNAKPRSMNEDEEKMYEAASNKGILLSNRDYLLAYYVGLLFTLTLWEHFTVSFLLIFVDISSYFFTRAVVHDVCVDFAYVAIALFFALQQNNNILVTKNLN